MDMLEADRIAHGVRAIDDPVILARLAERQIPCDVCPTSNALLGVFPSLADVPVRAVLDAGVPITLNTDGQLFFGRRLGEEYAAARETLGLSDEDATLRAIVDEIVATFAPIRTSHQSWTMRCRRLSASFQP